MAKQLGIIQFNGKLGNVVGAKKSAGQKENILRSRAMDVYNPKTQAQRAQRVKMTPAVNFYRALVGILDHSFQGVKYKGPSHNYFMKQAMLMEEGYPYLVKGDTRPVPGNYLISRGSLPPVANEVPIILDDAVDWNLVIDTDDFDAMTIGEFAQQVITNGNAQAGDQLTFIWVTYNGNLSDENSSFIYHVARIILNTEDENTMKTWNEAQNAALYSDAGDLKIDAANMCAAAIIVSRPPLRDGGAWQRSTTHLTISDEILSTFMSVGAQQAALESFSKKATNASTSDWFLNQGNDAGEGTGSGTNAQRTLDTANIEIAGQRRNLLVMIQGSKTYLVVSDIRSGKRDVYTRQGNIAIPVEVNVTDVEATGMQTRLFSTVKGYFPELEIGEGTAEDQP